MTICAIAQLVPGKSVDRQRIVNQLLEENLRAYQHRYADESACDIEYRYKSCEKITSLTAIEILKLCDHFDYQCCDAPDYPATEVAKIIELVRQTALEHILVQQDFAENQGSATLSNEVRLILAGEPGENRDITIMSLAGYDDAPWGI